MYKHVFPTSVSETFDILPSDQSTESRNVSNTTSPVPPISISANDNSATNNQFDTIVQEIEIDDDWDEPSSIRINQCYIDSFASIQSQEIPMTYKEATSPVNNDKWGPPIKAELQVMYDHNVWQTVPRNKDMKVIPTKWIFTTKADGTPKARIVAVGCRDTEIYSAKDTISPTPKQVTVRWLLAAVVQNLWSIVQLDVKNAFLHSNIDRIKYVSLPQGAPGNPQQFVCKLNRALC